MQQTATNMHFDIIINITKLNEIKLFSYRMPLFVVGDHIYHTDVIQQRMLITGKLFACSVQTILIADIEVTLQ